MPILSVIVPIYKAEKTIHKCIKSVLNQTFLDFELILVDDGSPDKSGEICDEYALKDSRIKVIHKGNGGVSTARNKGIDEANGKYICFVDSDDFIQNNYLAELVYGMEQGYDFVICGYNEFILSDSAELSSVLLENEQYVVVNKEYFSVLSDKNYISPPWNKVFRKSLIDKFRIRMPENLSLGEDMVFVFEYMNHIIDNDILFINKPLYNYCCGNNESLVNKYRNDLYDTNVLLNHTFNEYIKSWNLSENQINYFNNSCFYRMENVLINTFSKSNSDSFWKKLKYNRQILRSKEFKKWFSKFNGNMHFVYRMSYKLKCYLPVVILEKILSIKKRRR